MTKETEILSRLAANHLHLAQFEPLRAVLLALRTRNRDLARDFLQTIVARSGRFPNILYSPSCPSPALLTFLSTLELLQFDHASSAWSFDHETLLLRAEFQLLVQNLIDLVKDEDDVDELERCRKVLDKVLDLGVKRLRVNADVDGEIERIESVAYVEEGELMCLKRLILDHAGIFDALCVNIHRQIRRWECEDSGLTVTVRNGGERGESSGVELSEEEEDVRVFGGIQRTVQIVHMDYMKESVNVNDAEGPVSHIRFLHFDYGVEQSEYRIVLKDLLKVILSRRESFGDSWHIMRNQLLQIYSEALSSNCGDIVQMIQEEPKWHNQVHRMYAIGKTSLQKGC